MRVPPLPTPSEPVTEQELARVTIGAPNRLSHLIAVHDYDPAWPRMHADEQERIRRALGAVALAVEHIGSTSVPGLAAEKRRIAAQPLEFTAHYAEQKTETVVRILRRAGLRPA